MRKSRPNDNEIKMLSNIIVLHFAVVLCDVGGLLDVQTDSDAGSTILTGPVIGVGYLCTVHTILIYIVTE